MLFADVVAASKEVAGTRARTTKIDRLAALLRSAQPHELAALVGFLSGSPRQGKVGLGPSLLWKTSAPAIHEPSLSVAEVDALLDSIRSVHGRGAESNRERLYGQLLARATEPEQDYVRRLLGGGLRQGALEGVVTDAIAKASGVPAEAVRRALLLSGDLGTVAHAAMTEGREGLDRFRIQLFRPLEPMLAQSAETLEDALPDGERTAFEYKLDGARIQVHRLDDEVRVFTRNLNEVTEAVPEIVDAVRALPESSLILDGEAIALDAAGRPHPFQITMRRFGRRLDVERLRNELPLSARFFDCLHADGSDLIDHAARDRFGALSDRAPRELVVERLVTAESADARAFLERALRAGHEGLVAKSLSAKYAAGRRGAGWLKLKPVRTLDLVVLAVEWGSGRRQGFLSNIHLGARNPETGGFVMLGKTFKGMTDAMLAWQTERFLTLETRREGHIVHVRPEIVVEIAFDGLQESPHYPAGLALRFARVRRYRPDKSPLDADTIDTVRAMHEGKDRT